MFYEAVFRALNRSRVRYVVAGGVAVNLHGVPRMTQDLDLLVDLHPGNVRKLLRTLASLGYRPRLPIPPEDLADPSRRRQWIQKKHMKVFSFFHSRRPVQEIDILITAPVDTEIVLKRKVIKQAGNFSIPLASIPDLITMKKKARRRTDLSDIEMLKLLHKVK